MQKILIILTVVTSIKKYYGIKKLHLNKKNDSVLAGSFQDYNFWYENKD